MRHDIPAKRTLQLLGDFQSGNMRIRFWTISQFPGCCLRKRDRTLGGGAVPHPLWKFFLLLDYPALDFCQFRFSPFYQQPPGFPDQYHFPRSPAVASVLCHGGTITRTNVDHKMLLVVESEKKTHGEMWKELCAQATVEEDPQRPLELVQEIDRILEEQNKKNKPDRTPVRLHTVHRVLYSQPRGSLYGSE